jgi:predicted GNAT superfamily acetyltransferase
MDIEIKELSTFADFEEITSLQEQIWNLPDRDKISTITLRSLTMTYPIMGLILGAFHNNKMVGFVICLPTREPQTLYGLIMGVLPEYQNSEVGNKLGIKVLEKCVKQGVKKICWTFEPLESQHAHLYINKWGAIAVRFEQNYYQLKDEQNSLVPMDRFIVDCSLQSKRVTERINKKIKLQTVTEALSLYPVATLMSMPNEKEVLIKIPSNYKYLLKNNSTEAYSCRMETRAIFEEYINNRSYFIASMLSEEIKGERQCYYLMEKRGYL